MPSCLEMGMMVNKKYLKFQSNTSKGIGNKWGGTKNPNTQMNRIALLLYKYNNQAKKCRTPKESPKRNKPIKLS